MRARVSDLFPVSNATATASVSGGGSFTLLDNGAAPDAFAGDGEYAGSWTIPAPGTVMAESTRVMGEFLRDVLVRNKDEKNFPRHLMTMKAKCVRDTIAQIEASTDSPELIRLK